ncbi:NAD(P)/FAD-dependent oxidoreductase [Methanocalculus taiwanensis]|uniref:NAD(P)/FAD-dependent oxidoreductase n=1 Tax=Methanocalculus taiwanensis TaxID=106207 RepID=A0ABD4TMX0_9EURY|nr:NAD(P)/FAD-dependent oxidoreductase [Methanocalculus taiwanensis]MCQ1539348.1 NAD(P)/FAD-dependent oxidoreductase [Methanocalculus taiwanensis]
MHICVIGGGLAGLTAALRLSESHEVTILERGEVAGGCLSSYNLPAYAIESLYHHCFSGDDRLFSLLEECDLLSDLEWLKGSTGYLVNQRIYPLTTPLQILRYPLLTLFEKIRLGLFVLGSRSADPEVLDSVTAKDYCIERLGDRIYSSFFEPLLSSKFGERKDEVSAAWLVSRISIRSDRGPGGERLGYLKGGYIRLINALLSKLTATGCRIEMGHPVVSAYPDDGGWVVDGTRYDCIISTLSPQETARICSVPLKPLPYQGAACLTLGTPIDPTNGIYWVNMGDPAPYGAVITHTNLVPSDRYGEHIVYIASYFSDSPPENCENVFLSDFCTRFGLQREQILWHHLRIEPNAGPVYVTGYKTMMPEPNPVPGLFIAGMFSIENYPERSMEGSIKAGEDIARRVMEWSYI